MITNPDRSIEIAQLLVMPEPSLPSLSGVNFKRRVQKNEWFPLQFQLQELVPTQAVSRIITELKSEIDDLGIKPEVIIGTKPRNSDIPALLAKDLKIEQVVFNVETRQFEDGYPLSQLAFGNALMVEDFLTTGGIVLEVNERLSMDYQIKNLTYLSVVTYESLLGIGKLRESGIEGRSLTTAEEIMRNGDFLNRGSNRLISERRLRYLQSHGLI